MTNTLVCGAERHIFVGIFSYIITINRYYHKKEIRDSKYFQNSLFLITETVRRVLHRGIQSVKSKNKDKQEDIFG
jgi:hypothetical protein